MSPINAQAEELNQSINNLNPTVYQLLSKKGKAIFFPKKGILAQGQDAKGKEINATLGTALEEDETPMVLSCVSDNIRIDKKEAFPYAPSPGVADLRAAWKEKMFSKNPTLKGKEISKPIVTCALTHGLSMTAYMFIDEDDEIIHPDLFWGNYKLVFINGYGAKLKPFTFFKNNDFDIDAFKSAVDGDKIGKKIVLLNFPNNPSGYTPTVAAVKQIKDVLKNAAEKGNKILAILDDAYFGLVFEEGIYKESLFAELADLHQNLLAVKVDGITKEDYAWGLRVGFLTYGIKNGNDTLYSALEEKTAGAVRGNISNTCHLSQSLVIKSFLSSSYDEEKDAKYKLLKKRYDLVKTILKEHEEYYKYFEPLPYNSGYFMCVKLKNLDAESVRKTLLDKYSTGLIAIDPMLRIAFSSTPTDKLEKLFDNIYNACKDCAAV
jgi:aspartate/methionine/tyrosine aminotransferase